MTTKKTVSKKVEGFVGQVMNFLKVDDAKNAKAIVAMAKKEWAKQIKLKERKIKDVEEKLAEELMDQAEYLVEAKEALSEAYLNINVEVKGRDDIRRYLTTYEQQIANAKAKVESIEEVIDDKKSTVDTFTGKVNREIDAYKSNIKAIS